VLSLAQRAKFTARRKAIYLALHPETAKGGDRKSEDFKVHHDALRQNDSETNDLSENAMSKTPSFSEDTARRTGRSRRSGSDRKIFHLKIRR
jgi:hypothetical protein